MDGNHQRPPRSWSLQLDPQVMDSRGPGYCRIIQVGSWAAGFVWKSSCSSMFVIVVCRCLSFIYMKTADVWGSSRYTPFSDKPSSACLSTLGHGGSKNLRSGLRQCGGHTVQQWRGMRGMNDGLNVVEGDVETYTIIHPWNTLKKFAEQLCNPLKFWGCSSQKDLVSKLKPLTLSFLDIRQQCTCRPSWKRSWTQTQAQFRVPDVSKFNTRRLQ